MPIQQSDFIFRKPALVNDTGSNGGRMSAVALASAVKNNVWPDVPQSERTAGSTKYRKVFCHIANDDDLTLQSVKALLEKYSPADDYVTIFAGTHEDTQADLTGSERAYGCGQLDATVLSGVTTIDVLTEGAALDLFQNGDTVRISDKDGIGGAGNEEYVTLNAATTYVGDVATLSFAEPLVNGYTAAETRVASVINLPDVAASVSNWSESAAGSGTYDETGSPLGLDHIGSVSQQWTLTFTGATTFDVVGDVVGSVGSGNTGADFSPNNPDHAKPYFTLLLAGWAGTWANGDTVTFRTDPAALAIWEKRVIPPGASSLAGNEVRVAIDGASA
jgi:hypothetical protein